LKRSSFSIELSDLERILRLAGQNMSTTTVEEIRSKLEEIHQTDEVFLDDIEPILAMYWEELTDEEISNMLIESFEVFDTEQQGLIDRRDLIEHLTKLGDMPLNSKDLPIMFSLMDKSKTPSTAFDYRLFVKRLCGLEQPVKKAKKRKRRS
jgi:Ca2+-binding EF-hand superfamily protein